MKMLNYLDLQLVIGGTELEANININDASTTRVETPKGAGSMRRSRNDLQGGLLRHRKVLGSSSSSSDTTTTYPGLG